MGKKEGGREVKRVQGRKYVLCTPFRVVEVRKDGAY